MKICLCIIRWITWFFATWHFTAQRELSLTLFLCCPRLKNYQNDNNISRSTLYDRHMLEALDARRDEYNK